MTRNFGIILMLGPLQLLAVPTIVKVKTICEKYLQAKNKKVSEISRLCTTNKKLEIRKLRNLEGRMRGRPGMAALRLRQFHEANTRQEGESTLHSLRPRSRTEHRGIGSVAKFTLLTERRKT